MSERHRGDRYDVAIIGGGLTGLSLARQLRLASPETTVLLLDRRAELPPRGQKVGEATVQVSGYYFSKVLDLEEHLLTAHLMKYNLRFHWKTPGRENRAIEDYGQTYWRPLSNVASYQLDRNVLEAELLRLNGADARFTLRTSIRDLDVRLADEGPHALHWDGPDGPAAAEARWVVDTSGPAQVLARAKGLRRESPIRHGSAFMWVEGLVNVEKLTGRSATEVRLSRDRSAIGHLPLWLATNHFMGEGFWFWVIPLHGKTSLGLVYDHRAVAHDQVSASEKLVDWVCHEFPLFEHDLRQRRVLHFATYRDFASDCTQTIDPRRWAISGMAGRFSDPLYSPGGDLIALHNTLITDAILTDDPSELEAKIAAFEPLMRALYEAYVPSYAVSYEALGDQESFTLKYAWELAVYFAFYVFPFINDRFTDRAFVLRYLGRFAKLGRLNQPLQAFLGDFYRWRRDRPRAASAPVFFDLPAIGPLARTERTFYEVGLTTEEALAVLDTQLGHLGELARFIAASICATVLDDERALTSRAFVEALAVETLTFNPEAMRRQFDAVVRDDERYPWSFDVLQVRRQLLGPARAGVPV